MDTQHLALLAITFFAAIVNGALGYGFSSITVPLALLFLTNLTAILVVSVIFFWVLGFERVDDSEWELAAS